MSLSETSSQPLNDYEQRDPDVRLMLEVRNDSAAAFEELMLRYQNRVVTLLEHLTGKRDIAEDLAQDVFLRVYRARKTYVPESKFNTWLFTIVNNVALNAKRNHARRHEVNGVGSDSGTQPFTLADMAQAASGLMPTRQLDKAEMRDVVRLAIESLGEKQRLAVLLNKFENMGYEEIATTMGMSYKAIKSLLSRARENLRQILEPYYEQGRRPE